MSTATSELFKPYEVQQGPGGAFVICRAFVAAKDLKYTEAFALASALNAEHQKRMAQ